MSINDKNRPDFVKTRFLSAGAYYISAESNCKSVYSPSRFIMSSLTGIIDATCMQFLLLFSNVKIDWNSRGYTTFDIWTAN